MKDRPKLPFVGEDVFLIGKECTAGIHQRDDRKPVLPGYLLGAHMLARGHAEIGAALHSGVIGDDHALAALDHADTGDDTRARWHAIVFFQSGQLADLEEGRAGVDQALDAFARQDLALFYMPFARLFGAADALQKPKRMQFFDLLAIARVVFPEVVGPGIE